VITSANSNLQAANDSAVFQQDSPALSFLDIDAAARNIRKMADYFRGKKASLRPHVKVHKQIAAGAKGITVASVKPK
jgi:D-serine deaminase-like pyridoxal phosphate-dependent protein